MSRSNEIHMVEFSVKNNPPARDAHTLDHAFGSRNYPALVEKIRFGDVMIKQKALAFIFDQFHKQENMYSAVQADLMPALINNLMDANESVRDEAAKVFSQLASNIYARSVFINQKALPVLLHALKDPSQTVRYYTHKAFATFTSIRQGAQAALDTGLAPELLSISPQLDDLETLIFSLESLNNCIKSDPNKVLSLDGLKITLGLLHKFSYSPYSSEDGNDDSNVPIIKQLCSNCISGLCAPYEGKAEACKSDEVILVLLGLAKDSKYPAIQTSAMGALMNITIKTEGKRIAIKSGVSPLLIELLPKSEVNVIYTLKTITNVAEEPEGRKLLQPAIKIIQEVIAERDKSNDLLTSSVGAALAKLTFKP